ncbi:MAG: hypothetical protein KDE14_13070 [Rhodobacteraceae bacterium]|nr:hypothetical protein [Paracoccaceae bacterium]
MVTTWFNAIYETPFIDECPRGLNVGYDEYWWRGLSKEDRAKLTDNGLKSRLDRFYTAIRRGPNGEDVCLNPTAVTDPPLLTIEGDTSFGMDLDGNTDGNATANTCAHENFTGVDGTPGVDNQMYRILGCIYGFRSFGQYDVNANENRKSNGLGMTLLEISDVDDARNDDDVTLTIYRSIDQYVLDGQGKFVPFSSYRIDQTDGVPRYDSQVKGKIVDGELITSPGDVNFPFYGNYTYMNQVFRDMRMRMKIAENGERATGMVGAYFDIDQLMFYIGGLGPVSSTAISDCPAVYVAAHKYADGYPDPKTGKCTSLSTAYNFTAVSAFVIKDEQSADSSTGQ